jgi:Xaa-Pro aminopeptidase
MKEVYAQRRQQVMQALQPSRGVAIIPTAPEQARNRDSDFPYRHDSYFYYLTGFEEPGAYLVLTHAGDTVLFCRPKDLEREIWDGHRLGPEAAPEALGMERALALESLDTEVPRLLANQGSVWFAFATHKGLQQQVEGWLGQVRARVRQGVQVPAAQHDLCRVLDEMRLIKDRHEQDTMRRAAQISADAHCRAMQTSARLLREGVDLREYHLEAELLHAFRWHGAQAPAYTSIVAAGANACVLHYRAGNAPVRPGELCLIDAGCELDGYASDITRTFAADGKFTAPQRDLYGVVLAAQKAAIASTRVGARFNDPHQAALEVLTEGLWAHGLIDRQQHPTVEDALENKAYLPFYMHRTGHWLGMDVHDCGAYAEPAAAPTPAGDVQPPASRVLCAGMVLTIEPGLYVRPAPHVPEAFWHMGIRIEDDAIVTAQGCELISRGVPVEIDEIEALMRAQSGAQPHERSNNH